MEGKAILFETLARIDAYPICLDTQDAEEIIKTVKLIAPGFGAINLEDIASPCCFEIEARLKLELGLVVVDRNGIFNPDDSASMLHGAHREMPLMSNPKRIRGYLKDGMVGADAFVGVSRPGMVTRDMVATMNDQAIVFPMANPDPEIFPDEAKAGGAAIVGTGRSDYPNMINNVLVFPGILKGALAARARKINEPMKLAAAMALASSIPVDELTVDRIFPSPLDGRIPCVIAKAVIQAAQESGVIRPADSR